MDAELKSKWIEALRSGKYAQARRVLHNTENGGYCCLGVLCVVGGIKLSEDGKATVSDGGVITYDYESIDTLGLNAQVRAKLIDMNDEARKDFSQIADYIEQAL